MFYNTVSGNFTETISYQGGINMPGFDGTGPRGLGPMTGGGRGLCAPSRGGGFSGTYGASSSAMPAQAELELLRHECTLLQKELEVIETRIKTMEEEKSNKDNI
jgi:hypothetical protein